MRIFFRPRALKDLQRLPKDIQQRIIEKIEWYCAQEHPIQFAKFLSNHEIGQYRYRIGDYRVIFDVESDDGVVILRVGHRRNIYQ